MDQKNMISEKGDVFMAPVTIIKYAVASTSRVSTMCNSEDVRGSNVIFNFHEGSA